MKKIRTREKIRGGGSEGKKHDGQEWINRGGLCSTRDQIMSNK